MTTVQPNMHGRTGGSDTGPLRLKHLTSSKIPFSEPSGPLRTKNIKPHQNKSCASRTLAAKENSFHTA